MESKDMKIEIAQENTPDGERIIFNCPRCCSVNRVSVLDFCVADTKEYAIKCSNCGAALHFSISCVAEKSN